MKRGATRPYSQVLLRGIHWTDQLSVGTLSPALKLFLRFGTPMKSPVLASAMIALTAVSFTGCQRQKRADVVVGGHALVVSERLNCPESSGGFRRVAQSADGQACDYVGSEGEQLQLKRLTLDGASATDRLNRLKDELALIVPLPAPQRGTPSEKPATSTNDSESKTQRANDEDHAEINLPGLHVKTEGDKASVNLPGIHINAEGDVAHVSTGIGALKNAKIDANDDGARIEADMTDAANVDSTWFVVAKAAGPAGDHMVGYYARGPKSGPLVVAQLRSKSEHQRGSPSNLLGGDDVHRLVTLSLK